MSAGEIAVRVSNISKAYSIAREDPGHSTLGETLLGYLRKPLQRAGTRTFWALKDVSLEIRHGDVVGILGRNGAGKSTLLKILSRITEPTAGQIDLYGRVGALLEVGTGFHPELTGRENVFLNGAILGMRKSEIKRQFDDIVEFAEIATFIDTPVKRYSGGMYVRLAFAVAAHLDPSILIVDEVLAVGDAQFQRKCLGKMSDVSQQGRTVLFVSHSIAAIAALCRTAVFLKGGQVVAQGCAHSVAAMYQASTTDTCGESGLAGMPRKGSGKARFTSIEIQSLDCDGHEIASPITGCDVVVRLKVDCLLDFAEANVGLTLLDDASTRVVDAYTASHGAFLSLKRGQNAEVMIHLKNVLLRPGAYHVRIWIGRGGLEDFDWVDNAARVDMQVETADARHTEVFPGVYQCRFIHEINVA